jgi:hypothetical protein
MLDNLKYLKKKKLKKMPDFGHMTRMIGWKWPRSGLFLPINDGLKLKSN